jgi:hypothetical protein
MSGCKLLGNPETLWAIRNAGSAVDTCIAFDGEFGVELSGLAPVVVIQSVPFETEDIGYRHLLRAVGLALRT